MSEGTNHPYEKATVKALSAIGLYRILVFLMLVGILYLNSRYVQKTEFAAVQESIIKINTTLAIMAKQETQLADHEHRLRALERP